MTTQLHTASKNVHILDDAFPIPQLNRTRRIWIYLPEGYETSKKHYPVLYMMDGQNLFDNATSFSGEWEVDETLDKSSKGCIVVGIDNGGNLRINEYNPNDSEANGKGEGYLFLDFIVKTLKPYIDKKFRTLRSRKNTMIAGSSMGGLISFYAGILYPRVFGMVVVFSPAFWIAPQLKHHIKKGVRSWKHSGQTYYFYAGGSEDPALVGNMMEVIDQMRKQSGAKFEVLINPEGRHTEACWKEAFKTFYQWLHS